jgi:hypothetical protein
MSATVQQIRDAIAAKIDGIAGTGMVHSYERYAKNMGDLKTLYVEPASGMLKGWHVRRVTTVRHLDAIGRTTVDHGWELRAVMALDDASGSEKGFDTMIEAVDHAIRDDDTLGGLIGTTTVGDLTGLQIKDSGPAMFAGVLSHLALCSLQTRHFEGGG